MVVALILAPRVQRESITSAEIREAIRNVRAAAGTWPPWLASPNERSIGPSLLGRPLRSRVVEGDGSVKAHPDEEER
ncbi:hypothetical protein [Nonomuraea angiospora]